MGIGDRVEGSVEGWASKWSGGVRDWLGTVWGIFLKLTLQIFVPPAVQEKFFPQTKEASDFLRQLILGFIGSIGGALQAGQPQGRLFSYEQDRLVTSYRLDPLTVINLARRFAGKYPTAVEDLRDQGISENRYQALLDATLFYPSAQDLVTWTAREVFEPDSISKYGLVDEFDKLDLSLFAGAGVSEEQARNYWIAHWQHASYNQVVEMLHRGLITEADMYDWFRLVEIPPYWRDKLTQIAYNVPTRVDVRRFYDLKTIDETRLREIYTAMGYHDKDLDDYVLWTKIYVELPDLIARWKNGWITLEDAKSRLVELGMDQQAAEELVQTKVKVQETIPDVEAKQLTKTEIYKGVKLEALSVAEGIELLMDLEYTRDQAEFLLYTNVEALRGSPENFGEFKQLTDAYRRSAGLEVKTMPQELKDAAARVLELNQDVDRLKAAVKDLEDKIIVPGIEPESITPELDRTRAELANAEISLAEAKTRYETELAKWRHQER